MKRFNIRVYGLLVDADHLLVADEINFGMKMTKLPGGGLEFGEGLEACLRREWREELNVEIEIGEILYVNPFLQISAFSEEEEVMGLYFWVRALEALDVPFSAKPQTFPEEIEGAQVFRWIPIRNLQPEDFTFPIDQAMVHRLKAVWGEGR